jgi:hypothetical protein
VDWPLIQIKVGQAVVCFECRGLSDWGFGNMEDSKIIDRKDEIPLMRELPDETLEAAACS